MDHWLSDLVLFRAFKIVKELIHDKGVVYDAANRPVNLKDPEKLKTVSVIFALSPASCIFGISLALWFGDENNCFVANRIELIAFRFHP